MPFLSICRNRPEWGDMKQLAELARDVNNKKIRNEVARFEIDLSFFSSHTAPFSDAAAGSGENIGIGSPGGPTGPSILRPGNVPDHSHFDDDGIKYAKVSRLIFPIYE